MALEHQEKRARRLAERRLELKLTQEQVADRMQAAAAKLNPDADADRTRGQMVSDWERAVNDPSPAKIELLALALETTVADLNAGPKSERRKHAKTPDPFGDAKAEPMPGWAVDLQGKVDQILEALGVPTDPATELDEDLERTAERTDAQDEGASQTRSSKSAKDRER